MFRRLAPGRMVLPTDPIHFASGIQNTLIKIENEMII